MILMRYLILLTFILNDAKYAHGSEQLIYVKSLFSKHLPTTGQSIVHAVQPKSDYDDVEDSAVADWIKQGHSVNGNPFGNQNPVDQKAFENFEDVPGSKSGIVYQENPEINVKENSEIDSKISPQQALVKDEITEWLLGGTTTTNKTQSIPILKFTNTELPANTAKPNVTTYNMATNQPLKKKPLKTTTTVTPSIFKWPIAQEQSIIYETDPPTISTTFSTTAGLISVKSTNSPKSFVPVTSTTTASSNSNMFQVNVNTNYSKKIPSPSPKIHYPSWPFQAWLNNCSPPLTQENCFPSNHQQQHTSNPITAPSFDVKPVTLGVIPYNVHGFGKPKNWGRARVINYIYINTCPDNNDHQRPVYDNPRYPYTPQTHELEIPIQTALMKPSVVYSAQGNRPAIAAEYPVNGGVLPTNNIKVDANHPSYLTNPQQAGQWLNNHAHNNQQLVLSYVPQQSGTALPSSSAVYSTQTNQPIAEYQVYGGFLPANNIKNYANQPPYPTNPGAKQRTNHAYNNQHIVPSYFPQASGTALPNSGVAETVDLIAMYPNGDNAPPVEQTDLAAPEYMEPKQNYDSASESNGYDAPLRVDIPLGEDYGTASMYEQPEEDDQPEGEDQPEEDDETLPSTLKLRRKTVAENNKPTSSRDDGNVKMPPTSTTLLLQPGAPEVEQTEAVSPVAMISAASDAEPWTPVVQTEIPAVEASNTPIIEVQTPTVSAGIHRPSVGRIHDRDNQGAFSIVLSGGYEDDVDNGDEFMYTGSGGRDLLCNKCTALQSCDQKLTRYNKALALNCDAELSDEKGATAVNWKKGKPVRVVRNYKLRKHSKYAPECGNRYDGIYKVVKYYPEMGKSGYIIWRYVLKRDDTTPAPWSAKGKKLMIGLGLDKIINPENYLTTDEVSETDSNLVGSKKKYNTRY